MFIMLFRYLECLLLFNIFDIYNQPARAISTIDDCGLGLVNGLKKPLISDTSHVTLHSTHWLFQQIPRPLTAQSPWWVVWVGKGGEGLGERIGVGGEV